MKVNIRRLADGGGFATFTPIIHNFPGTPSSGNQPTSETPKQSSSILDEKMLEHLYKQGGLVNDVNKLVSELIQLEKASDMPFLNSQNRSTVLRIVAKINEVNQNKEYWKDAISRSKESGGFGEVAVDNGRIFTKTRDNKIQSMSLSEYSGKRDRVKPLSVQELMYERQYNPSLTGQNGVFTVADNAIGLNKITEHIKSIISALGSETMENSQVFSKTGVRSYIESIGGKTPTQEEMKSLGILNKVLNSSSEYSQVSVTNSSERNQLGKALSYIWNTLGSPAQQKLAATAAINGVDDPKRFILQMLESQSDISEKTSITPIADHTATGKPAPTTKEPNKIALTPSEMFHMDKLYQPGTTYTLNNPDAGIQINMVASGIAPLFNFDKDGTVIPPSIISNILTKNNYQAIVNQNEAYIGDTKIDPSIFGEMVSSGDDVAKVYMPVKSDGSPDLAGLERFKKVYTEFQQNKDKWSSSDAERWFANNDFRGIKIKEVRGIDGSVTKEIIENNTVKPFLAVPILTNSASDLSENPWMVKLTGTTADNAKIIMEKAFTVYGGTPSKPTSKNLAPDNFGPEFINPNKPYKGTLFIQYRPEASAFISSMHSHLMGTAPSELDVERNLQYSNNNEESKISGGASVLQ